MLETIQNFIGKTGVMQMLGPDWWQTAVMWVIAFVLIYLAIGKKFEPLLLLPIAFGMLLANLPGANLIHMDLFLGQKLDIVKVIQEGSLIDFLYLGVKLGIYPSLIFLGVGAMTDFTALIANPKSLLMGAGAQLGVFVAFFGALLLGFSPEAAGAIGIIGGADGPTSIFVTRTPLTFPFIAGIITGVLMIFGILLYLRRKGK